VILDVAGDIKIEDPDAEVLAERLHELYAGINDSFIILIKSDKDNDYMQATIDVKGLFLVEYREGAAKRHYRIESLGKEETLLLFQDYLRVGSSWRHCVAWQDVSSTFCWDARQSETCTSTQRPLTKEVEIDEVIKESRGGGVGARGEDGLSLDPQGFTPLVPCNATQLTGTEVSFPRQEVVYLLKAGPYYKIGKAKDLDQRIKQIKLQLPYPVETLHSIKTDDSMGIESYWHKRFACKRANGEWFLLTDDDVATFVSRETM